MDVSQLMYAAKELIDQDNKQWGKEDKVFVNMIRYALSKYYNGSQTGKETMEEIDMISTLAPPSAYSKNGITEEIY